ncbi:MAG: hypothetical protein GX022_02515 [Clostridiaceae bacterium]|nr:hypothetical protein [Clostridiaceae bacterium]
MMANLKSQKGSSMILISLLLVTLVVFALLSVTISASELRLSQRNAENHKTYYLLDSEAKRFLYDIKGKIKKILDFSDNTVIFFKNLDSLLNEGINRTMSYRNGVPVMIIERNFVLEENSRNMYLKVKLLIREPNSIEDNANDICSVLEWRFWHEPFEFKN